MARGMSLTMVLRCHYLILALSVLFLAISMIGLARLQIVTTADAFIDPSLKAAADYRRLKELFPNQSEILILARPHISVCQLKEPWFQLLNRDGKTDFRLFRARQKKMRLNPPLVRAKSREWQK